MGNKKTPLLLKLRSEGGTLYVFPSALEDIALNLSATTSGVAMSHYALLNIPTIDKADYLCKYDIKGIQDNNIIPAISLLNYMMNFETLLTNREDYNYQDLQTVSEQAFWHWALKVGIIKESSFTKVDDNIYIDTNADRTIKCFGSIDAGNTLSTEFGMFNETYINIPTSYGAGPVYLEVTDTDNYHTNVSYLDYTPEYLEGRTDRNSYYSYTGGNDYPFLDTGDGYLTNSFDGLKIVKNLSDIQNYIKKTSDFNNTDKAIITSYDDLNIDVNNYFNIESKFEFNAILLYYSVYDQDDMIKTPYATNLFGIIFLDGVRELDDDETKLYIAPIEKRKSSVSAFGNSYSFRVNLKSMSVYDNTDAVIQDNTTMSSIAAVDFSDAISLLNQAVDILNSNNIMVLQIQNKYAAILQYYDELQDRIQELSENLNSYLKGTRSSFIDTSVLYANAIRTTKSNPNEDIKLYIGQESTEPLAIANNDGIRITDLTTDKLTTNNNYIHIDGVNSSDLNFINNSLISDVILDYIQNPLKLSVMLTSRDSIIDNTGIYNMYINPDSEIFGESDININFLKSDNGDIDYVKLIPYIIAIIQRYHSSR